MNTVDQTIENEARNVIVSNICGKFMLSMHPLDLEAISSKIWNSSYNKKRLPAIIIRKTKPRATVLLFRTGRGLIIGAETVQNLEQVAKKMAKEMTMIMNAGKIELIEIAVTNVMGVGTLGFNVDLPKLCENRRSIKNENCPGVFYKLGSPLQKVLVYQSGKLIFWGAKTTEDIELSFEIMKREMKLYEVLSKKGEEESPSLDQTIF